jgi:hypothetical protein
MPIHVEFELDNSNYGHIHIADPTETVRHLKNPDEIVIPMWKIIIIIVYPLNNPVRVELNSNLEYGFERAELAGKIALAYQKIYREEDEAVGPTGNIPGMFNRKTSFGPYGIWGHHIDDLDLIRVEQIENNIFGLSVDS